MNSEFTIAVHSLVLLAYRPDHMATSDMIAHNVCTHPARVRKVMSCLRKMGYVATKEGSGGGYLLSCDPEVVTLAEIYRTTSIGSIKPAWCSGDVEQGLHGGLQYGGSDEEIFTEAEQQLLNYLQHLTVSHVLERLRVTQQSKG